MILGMILVLVNSHNSHDIYIKKNITSMCFCELYDKCLTKEGFMYDNCYNSGG